MKLAPWLVITLLAAAAMLPIAWSARRLGGANDAHATARASLDGTRRDVERLDALRSRQQHVAERKRPEQDLIARTNAVLESAELGPGVLGAVRTRSDAALPGASATDKLRYRRQTIQLSLRRLTLIELGRFLGEWTSTQELWTPTEINLTHVRGSDRPGRFDASILVSATYIADR